MLAVESKINAGMKEEKEGELEMKEVKDGGEGDRGSGNFGTVRLQVCFKRERERRGEGKEVKVNS